MEGPRVLTDKAIRGLYAQYRRQPVKSQRDSDWPPSSRWQQRRLASPVPLVEYYRTLRGEHPDWDECRQAMVTDQRCLLKFHILRAGPDRSG